MLKRTKIPNTNTPAQLIIEPPFSCTFHCFLSNMVFAAKPRLPWYHPDVAWASSPAFASATWTLMVGTQYVSSVTGVTTCQHQVAATAWISPIDKIPYFANHSRLKCDKMNCHIALHPANIPEEKSFQSENPAKAEKWKFKWIHTWIRLDTEKMISITKRII